ncbi:unnamed protein product [Rhizoctonia solani]|uniref:Thiamine phosphate synthase/TenI domain-containing protein n=1 Tax=Rhizoctonia solani TaxID=456999 RepID=A0A8H3BZT7_9AGAM|nr:unnamed protein product [Rhizoctonia solani]
MLWLLHLLNAVAYASVAASAALNSRQMQWPTLPNNLTEDVLKVAFAISPPCAANSSWCQQLTQVVIPRCERLRGDPGCWCGNHDPVHYCAICMTSPADNQTSPDQMQAASAGHAAFHVACNAYEELINGTASTTSSTSMLSTTSQTPTATAVSVTSSNNKVPIGPIVGGVVGGVVGLALVVGIIYLLAIVLKKNDRRSEFLEIARRTKQICDKYSVPMFVNDRVDVALAIGATGVHLGQSDMPVSTARKLLELAHPDSPCLIGVSVGNVDEAKRAVRDGADYVGIGVVWDTKTKDLVKPVVGVRGVGDILDIVGNAGIPAVAIGGIKIHNALHTLHGAVGPITGTALSGLAVVTEIVSAPDASIPAKALTKIINSRSKHFHWPALCLAANTAPSAALLAETAGSLLTVLREQSPLIHQITNNVVIAQSANATLALGASPIMATAPEEMNDLGKVAGGLLVNFGTITNKAGMLVAGKAANANKKPVVFDPVGVGATQFRRESANELLNSWQVSVIKGNAGEIGALLGSSEPEVVARGVDSTGPGFSDPANIVRTLAKRELVMTGKTDYVSDGYTAVALTNGHSMLGDITGSGCIVGTAITAFAAASCLVASEGAEDEGKLVRGDMFQAAVGGVLAINIASEIAAARPDVKGTGTFMSALIDELYNLKPQTIADRAMVEIL